MRKKIIIINSLIICFALILMFVFSIIIISKQNKKTYYEQAKNYLSLSSSIFDGTNFDKINDSINEIESEIRLTIIDLEGNVIIDTDKSNIEENHLDRPEIQTENLGEVFERYSVTEKKNMLYIANIDDGYYIRISISMGDINRLIDSYTIISIIILFSLIIISIFLTYIFSKLSLKSVNGIVNNLAKIAEIDYDETNITIDDLPSVLSSLNVYINNRFAIIDNQKDELITVLNLLNQGVITLTSNKCIKLINKKGREIFNCVDDIIGKKYIYLFRDIKLQSLIEETIENKKNTAYTLFINKNVYYCMVNYIKDTWLSGGVIITIDDITVEYNLNKTKKDFFQNASHELKSPLTSIIGYEQMIVDRITDNETQVIEYSNKALKEAKRMNNIIIDMLNLSELEQNYQMKYDSISVKDIIIDILNSLENRIKTKNITLNIEIDECKINGDSKLIDQLIRNIIDNAIKYNKQNGKIDIKMINNTLTISDTGIGIAEEDQMRVFERFYRVDKGRSKEIGGTGLGLAIVKHVCDIYNYKLTLKSVIEYGTTISVSFI